MVILDTGTSVPIINKSLTEKGKVFRRRRVEIFDWKNETTFLDDYRGVSSTEECRGDNFDILNEGF